MEKSFQHLHTRSESERQFHTLSHLPPDRRRLSADEFDAAGSRAIALPHITTPQPLHADKTSADLEAAQWHVRTTSRQQSKQYEIDRLLVEAEELKREVRRLGSVLSTLREREEAVNQRELDLDKYERNWSLKEARRESEYSDKNFELGQKRRDLQLLEDQLHMKGKDLKHKEFDLISAGGATDISSSKMADLADRHYELDKREEALDRREQSLLDWDRKLSEKDQAARLYNLQQMEPRFQPLTSLPSQGYPPGYNVPGHTQRYVPDHTLSSPRQPWTEAHAPSNWSSRPQRAEPVGNFPSNRIQASEMADEPFPKFGTAAAEMPPAGQMIESLPPSPPQDEPITLMGHASPHHHGDDQFSKDVQLARQLEEEDKRAEEEQLRKRTATDLLVALSLQQEDFTGEETLTNLNQLGGEASSEVTASVIKRELDTRLTREQSKQKQEQEDFIYAQNLVSSRNNSENIDQPRI